MCDALSLRAGGEWVHWPLGGKGVVGAELSHLSSRAATKALVRRSDCRFGGERRGRPRRPPEVILVACWNRPAPHALTQRFQHPAHAIHTMGPIPRQGSRGVVAEGDCQVVSSQDCTPPGFKWLALQKIQVPAMGGSEWPPLCRAWVGPPRHSDGCRVRQTELVPLAAATVPRTY